MGEKWLLYEDKPVQADIIIQDERVLIVSHFKYLSIVVDQGSQT